MSAGRRTQAPPGHRRLPASVLRFSARGRLKFWHKRTDSELLGQRINSCYCCASNVLDQSCSTAAKTCSKFALGSGEVQCHPFQLLHPILYYPPSAASASASALLAAGAGAGAWSMGHYWGLEIGDWRCTGAGAGARSKEQELLSRSKLEHGAPAPGICICSTIQYYVVYST